MGPMIFPFQVFVHVESYGLLLKEVEDCSHILLKKINK